MKNFFDWIKENRHLQDKPWLILGKGPSFSKLGEFDISDYSTISLNHVVRELKVKITHAIDFDVVIDCQESIKENAEYLLLPFRPNFNNQPGNKSLPELINEHEILHFLNNQGRLLWYDLKLVQAGSDEWRSLIKGKQKNKNYPIVPATYFSVEAALNLLALADIKTIRSLGIDGGTTYSKSFDNLKEKTLLSNGQPNFDIQFISMSKTMMEKNINYSSMTTTESPIKVFVGSMPEQMLAVKVLEYSIKKYASISVDVIPLFKNNIIVPMPKDPKNKPRTPFSFQRFLIPELKKFKGRGIYVDSDMQVFTDIKDLWIRPMDNCEILSAFEASGTGRRPQFAVMLLDCEKLQWKVSDVVAKLDKGDLSYEELMYEMKVSDKVCPVIEREWNSLEFYEEGKTCLLHYTDMNSQPWLFTHNPLASIWVKELIEAIEQKFISISYLRNEVIAGNVRPSLLYQVKKRITETTKIPAKIKKLDNYFIPPHMRTPQTSKLKLAVNRLYLNIFS